VVLGSIKQKLMMYVGLLVLFICLGLSVLAFFSASNSLKTEVEVNLADKANDISNLIRTRLDVKLYELSAIAARSEVQTMDWKKMQSVLLSEVERTDFATIALVYPNGTAFYVDGSTLELGDRDYVREAFTGKDFVSDMLISRAINQPVAMVSTPIYNQSDIVGF
jgi:methyl-accepting chemotaxis protein